MLRVIMRRIPDRPPRPRFNATANSSAVCTAAIAPLAQAARDADVFRVARAIHPTIADMRVGKSKFDQISEQIDRARLPACRACAIMQNGHCDIMHHARTGTMPSC